ncbi:GGDEF domain-containing protein [Ectothiorhodospiraceae bacterium WFHF3C12]|nr:GGDEF domain-containing protein [Ectothiorhodospiraceae bacterium WFHF3C12]
MALLVVTIVGALLFGVLNLQRGVYALAGVELAMGAVALALMFVVRQTPHLTRWTLAYLLPFFSALLFALATPRASPTVFVWVLLIPMISHLLLGRWLGLAMAGAFLFGAGAIYFGRFGDNPELVNTIGVANVAMSSAVILALSHVAEYTRERSERRLAEQASTDALTGLANRSHLKTVFQRELDRAERQPVPLSLILMDLDHFKRVNDRHGHEAGDAALVHVAALLRQRLRATDVACRQGGEEFAILLVDSDIDAAAGVAEALRASLGARPVRLGAAEIPLTASFGVAQLGADGHDLDRLLSAADERLFAAKARGRNCVVRQTARADSAAGTPEPTSTDGALA